jgi:UDP-N-acetylmuramoyl-tripeptide--D-alanyl-D-alanine ligase
VFTDQDIRQATGAQRSGTPARVTGVSTDSRAVARGQLYVALRGARFDGHDFVAEAAARGAAAVLVARRVACAVPQYLVPDTRAGYQALSRCHRERFSVPVAAITGTNGKTTVKEMTACILARRAPVLASALNFNNQIGVPMTLLRLTPAHRYAVIEMGMNHAGELRTVTQLAQPTVAVITNVGRGHLEFFADPAAVVAAKLEVLEGLRAHGVAVLPYDSPWYVRLYTAARAAAARIVSVGSRAGADVRVEVERVALDATHCWVSAGTARAAVRLRVPGAHNAGNAALACATAQALEPQLSLQEMAEALRDFAPVALRCQCEVIGGVTVIADCYNANPESMQAALTLLRDAAVPGRRIAVLGDMCELGAASAAAHRELGEASAHQHLDLLLATGAGGQLIAAAAHAAGMNSGSVQVCATAADAAAAARAYARPGDCLLIKGSRAMRLETVLAALRTTGPQP